MPLTRRQARGLACASFGGGFAASACLGMVLAMGPSLFLAALFLGAGLFMVLVD